MNTINMNKLMARSVGGIFVSLLIGLGMIGGAIAFAEGADTTPGDEGKVLTGIMFPIAELGACADKAACKAYCDDADHAEACIAFAKEHGLINKTEADRSAKFVATVKAGKGPGGCTSPASCKAYCEDLSHMDECVSFAEKNDFKGEEYKQGKQLSTFLKQGGKTPGNCSSKQECQAYCGDFSHAEECSIFSQKMGGNPGGKIPTSEQLKKLSELAKNGETPGGCTSKDACESYCHEEEHFEECAAFGEKVGFIAKDEGEKIRKIHVEGGPGGCKSPDACRAYCDDQTHHEECFKFASDNGLIPKQDLAQMKEGLLRMREGIANAPEEVQACLKTVLGDNVLDDLQSGKLAPGPELGEKMRTCFEKFGGVHDPKDIIKKAPPEVQSCLNDKLGDELSKVTSGKEQPTAEVADTFRICFQQIQFIQQGFGGPGGMGSSTMNRGPMQAGEMMPKPNPDMFKNFLRSAPPEVAACVKEKLGDDAAKIESGDLPPTPELGQKLRPCFEQFRPNSTAPAVQGKPMMPMDTRMQFKLPPQVMDCLKDKMSEDDLQSIGSTRPTPEMEQLMRSCFKATGGKMVPPSQGQGGGINMQMRSGGMGSTSMPSGDMRGIPTDAINQMPPQVAACIKEKMSSDGGTGTLTREQMGEIMGMCLKQFGGAMPPQNQSGMMPPPDGGMMQKPPMDGSQPSGFVPPPLNTIPPSGTMDGQPQSMSFSQTLVAGAAMPFVLLWNIFH